jgi:DNA mismatch endonuclease (patch repair protein)
MDRFTPEKRRWLMGRIKNKNTAPEKLVRSVLHRLGYRFRLQGKDLPGKPDIVLPRHRKVIFVHGCFWHGHPGCPRAARPTTNTAFWDRKIDANIARDQDVQSRLSELGWSSLVVWQCRTRSADSVRPILVEFLTGQPEPGVSPTSRGR